MKESMGYKGKNQGDMSPKVADYQPKVSEFSQTDANKTTQYVERREKIQTKEANQIKKQSYKGRYD